MPRLDRTGWILLGMEALLEPTSDALTLEAICKRAKRTRGSFYHHFESVSEFIHQLALHWERCATQDVIRTADKSNDSMSRYQSLDTLTQKLDPKMDQGMRRLALLNSSVKDVVSRVDNTRIAYLAGLHQNMSQMNQTRAHQIAQIEYAAYLGFQQLDSDELKINRNAVYALFSQLVSNSGTSQD